MPSASVADLAGDVGELGLEAASRSTSGSKRGSRRASARASWSAWAVDSRAPAPSAVSASWTVAAPRAIASPCCAALQTRPDLLGLARPQAGAGDLVRLVLEELEPPGELARVDGQLGEAGAVGPPALDRIGHRPPRRLVPAEGVEQVALPALVEQPLLVVLAVDLDERPDLVGEPRGGRRASSSRAVERPPAATSRTAMSGSGSRSNRASTRATSAPWRTRDVSARAPLTSPSASISRLLPAPVSPVMHVEPGLEGQPQPIDQREVRDGQLEEAAGVHDGSSATLWRSRSQNGWAPFGSMSRIGRSPGPDLDDVADRDRDVLAAVDRDERLVRVDDRQRTDLERADDDRPDRREVGGDRRHDEVAARRIEDRAAGRERVAGRAGRAGDDEAVGDERREVGVVDRHVEPADAGQRAARDDDVVEGEVDSGVERLAAAQDPALERHPLVDPVLAGHDAGRGPRRARRPRPSRGSRPCRG